MTQEQIDSMIAYYTRQHLAGKITDYQFDSMIEVIRQELIHQQQLHEVRVTPEDAASLRALGLTVHDITPSDVDEYIARENELAGKHSSKDPADRYDGQIQTC